MSHQPDHSLTSVSEFEAAAVQGVTEVLLSCPDGLADGIYYMNTQLELLQKARIEGPKTKYHL